MLCKNCKKLKPEINLKHLALCSRCFSKIVEKRVRKYVRINKIFRKNDSILVYDKSSYYLIKRIIKELPVRIFFRKNADNKFIKRHRINKIVVLWTLDDEINLFLEKIFLNKKYKKINCIKLLKQVTDAEARLFADCKGLKFKENKKNEDIEEFIDKLSYKYPEIRFSLLKSREKLKEAGC